MVQKKVLIWLQVRILDFYHKLFPWAWMIPFPSLLLHTCVAYMSIVTFICDDYTTCLKIINCITQVMQVMIILGPCRNNWVTNFRQERPSLLFFVHTQNANCSRQMQIAHSSLKNKIINKSDWCWQRWLCDWVTQLVRLQCFQGVLVTGVRFRLNKISSFKHATCNYPS